MTWSPANVNGTRVGLQARVAIDVLYSSLNEVIVLYGS
jgi:hypothetical protein